MFRIKKKCISIFFGLSMIISSFGYGVTSYATENGDVQEAVTEAEPVTENITEAAPTPAPEPVTEAMKTTEVPTTEVKTTEAKTTEAKTVQEKKTEDKKKKTTESKNKKATEESATESATETPTQLPVTPADNGVADASIEKARKDAEEASEKRKAAQEVLNNLELAKSNIEENITMLDKMLNDLQKEITKLEKIQGMLETSIADTQIKLDEAKKAQDAQYDAMKLRIQMVYESGQKRYLDVLLSATSMSDVLNKTEYVNQVSLYDYNLLKELKEAKEQVANLKQKLDKDLEVNEDLQSEVKEQKDTMEEVLAQKSIQVAQYAESIKNQEEEVAKYKQAQEEAESIIAAAELAASSNVNFVYTGGAFLWPVPGYNTITSQYGGRNSPIAGASSNHRGIDIACDTGSNVVAAASGTVIVATYNYAEGNYVCIDHGGGVVTVYMHNSSLLVSVGESVTAGQSIALAGSTGVSTGPHCHFGVRVNGEYVDPLLYLQ